MEFDMPTILRELIGLSCCDARLIGGALNLSFGKRIDYQNPELIGLFYGEWEVSSETSAWRLVKANEIVCGSYDEDVSSHLNSLVRSTIIDIKQVSQYDVCLYFNNEYEVCFMAESQRGAYLSIIAPGKQYIALTPGNKWIQISSESPLELSKEEERYYTHSELCFKRWEKIVNVVSKKHCCECIYFIALRGRFYFGDFGLCSNRLSPFDGKVVAMSSGCKGWGTEYENTWSNERTNGK